MADLEKLVLMYTQNLVNLGEKGKAFENFLRIDPENFEDLQKLLTGLFVQITEGKIHRRSLFAEIFGLDKTYQTQKMQKLLSIYLGLLKDFLALHQLKKEEGFQEKMLLNGLRDARITEDFLALSECFEETTELKAEANRHLLIALQKEDRYFYESELNPKERKDLEEALEHFDRFYQIKRLKICIELLICDCRQGKNDPTLLAKINEHLKSFDSHDYAIIAMLTKAIKFYVKKDKKTYLEMKNKFYVSIPNIFSEKKELFLFNVNALYVMTLSTEEYLTEYFEWYLLGDEKELLLDNGVLDEISYMNVIRVACLLKEYNWAKYFKEKYINFIDVTPTSKDRLEKQSSGLLLFGEGRFMEGLTTVKGIKITKPEHYFKKYLLIFKLSYEIYQRDVFVEIDDEFQKFQSTINRYLRKKKIRPEIHIKYVNFLKLLSLISDSFSGTNNKETLFLKLNAVQYEIVEYAWLKEKIEELP